MDNVIVLSDNTILDTSTKVIILEGIVNEAKGPKSSRKLFHEATCAGDCESTNINIRRHYYIMGPNGELERKMFSPKPLKNDGRPPIPNASPAGSSCASLASPVGWRSKYTKPLAGNCSIENHHGAIWSIAFETIDGKHYFTHGLFHFARDNALRRGDLLVTSFSLKLNWSRTRFPPFDLAEALGMESDEIDTSDDDSDISLGQEANDDADAGAP
ncbi:B3 domain-containing protein REM20-like [Salvia divinorum]|uniref:B3 domain-containing protein REM20-like n=1 Tax=Salvia divinorum TaxID=28513 RepID=A0ABD1GI67_SALDI